MAFSFLGALSPNFGTWRAPFDIGGTLTSSLLGGSTGDRNLDYFVARRLEELDPSEREQFLATFRNSPTWQAVSGDRNSLFPRNPAPTTPNAGAGGGFDVSDLMRQMLGPLAGLFGGGNNARTPPFNPNATSNPGGTTPTTTTTPAGSGTGTNNNGGVAGTLQNLSPLAIALLGGLAGLTGALGNSAGARTSTGSGSSVGTSSTQRDLRPFQEELIPGLSGLAAQMMGNPEELIRPIREAGTSRINRSYARVPDRLARQHLAYGGTSSGKMGRALRETELSRVGDIADFEASILPAILEERNRGAGLAERLLGINFGQSTASGSSYDQTGTGAGSAAAGGLSSALETVLALMGARGVRL